MLLNSANQLFVTGYTQSCDFPVVNGYRQLCRRFRRLRNRSFGGWIESGVLHLRRWQQRRLPTRHCSRSNGNIYIGGYTYSLNYPTVNAFQASAQPNQVEYYGLYGFVSKLSADGSTMVYSTYVAGNSNVAENCGYPCWPDLTRSSTPSPWMDLATPMSPV